MKSVLELHRQAMEFADTAFVALHTGDHDRAKEFYCKALQYERDAANRVAKSAAEPTRSVLYRSAASMALNCGQLREAERLIAGGLAGDPPEEIAEEMRDLLEQVYFQRHLELRGITLEPDEFQVSLFGRAVGTGMVEDEQFFGRLRDADRLIHRTAQRKQGFPYKDKLDRATRQAIDVFVSVPKAACFAVTFKIGTPEQLHFPSLGLSVDVIDDLLTCFELYDRSDVEALKEQIKEDAYYSNFVALAGRIAPDGDAIKKVVFSAVRDGNSKSVTLAKPQSDFNINRLAVSAASVPEKTKEPVRIIGRLNFADSRTGMTRTIQLEDRKGRFHRVIVPEGMMADIVKPMFESTVEITGRPKGKSVRLEGIKEIVE
jgi:hypothetical protein